MGVYHAHKQSEIEAFFSNVGRVAEGVGEVVNAIPAAISRRPLCACPRTAQGRARS